MVSRTETAIIPYTEQSEDSGAALARAVAAKATPKVKRKGGGC